MRILIVEDDFVSRNILLRSFEGIGISEIAVNGVEAIDAVRKGYSEDNPYDLICLDLQIPEYDGHSVLRDIREIEKDHEIPLGDGAKVMITTSESDAKIIVKSFREQCDAYLIKPYTKAKLRKNLKEIGFALFEA